MKELKKKFHPWQIVVLIFLVVFGFIAGELLPRLNTAKATLANDWAIYRGNKEKSSLSKYNSFPLPDLGNQLSLNDSSFRLPFSAPAYGYEISINPENMVYADNVIYFTMKYADIVDSWDQDYSIRLFAVNMDGTLKWSKSLTGVILTSAGDHGSYTTYPSITSDGRIYVGVRDKIYCVNKDDPNLSCWSFPTYNLTGKRNENCSVGL